MIQRGFDRAVKRQKRTELSDQKAAEPVLEHAVNRVRLGIEAQFERSRGKGRKPNWFKLLNGISPDQLADTAVRTCMDGVARGWSFSHLVVMLGRRAEALRFATDLKAEMVANNAEWGEKNFDDFEERVKKKAASVTRRQSYAKWYAQRKQWVSGLVEWDNKQLTQAAQLLYLTIQQEANDVFIFPMEAISDDESDEEHANKRRVVRFTPEIEELLRDRMDKVLWRTPDFSPMSGKPNRWGESYGPYNMEELAVRVPMVRNIRQDQDQAIKMAIEAGDMDEAIDALNFLQEVPLSINRYCLEAVLWAVEDIPNRADAIDGFPVLEEVKELKWPKDTSSWTDKQIATHARSIQHREKRNATVKSNRAQLQDDIEEALGLATLDQMYFPYNWDTRSRVYHVPRFGHHRPDHIRGLIQFANGCLLDETNSDAVKIQIANTWANAVSDEDDRKVDKLSFDDRKAWVDANEEIILLCGENFADPRAFAHWSTADEPVQHLAACRDWYLYRKFDGKGGHVSHLPIAYDGTNSGLQHYSGLSRAQDDGKKVNLVPGNPVPEDIYLYVAAESTRIAREDLEGDDEEKAFYAGLWLNNYKIDRGVCKRNTMTYVYSSNQRGMADQIREDTMQKLNDAHAIKGEPHPFINEDTAFKAANYLGGVNMRAIRKVIKSAEAGMDFLRNLCRIMYQHDHHMHWVTPIGFPVYHMKTGSDRQRIASPFFNSDTGKMIPENKFKINFRKPNEIIDRVSARNGVAPSFIHSLDATHLMLAANKCREYGVDNLLVVHDSFATDAANAHLMNECVRAAFVELYLEQDHFGDLLEQCKVTLDAAGVDISKIDWPQVPEPGTLDLMRIMDCLWAFS